MKYLKLNSEVEFVENEERFLSSPNEESAIVTLKQTEAIYCDEGSCNIEWCEKNNIPYARQPQNGGCIIGVKGNVFMNIKRKSIGGECFGDRLTKAFAKYLKDEKNLNSVRCDNNDVLVDGFKVASAVETTINGWQYMSFQASLHQDIETIKNVCNKPMVKVPKGLSDYGITTNEIELFCEKFIRNN